MSIIVSGSLAYDRIMDFPEKFSDHILPDKLHVLNVSFTVNGMVEKLGGTAGNIAYALSLLGEKPVIVATIGQDYHKYFQSLADKNISTDGIRIIEEEFTASAYITTDRADNQITGFNPGAMKYPSCFNFEGVNPEGSIVIVAPGNVEDMMNYSRICRSKGIDYIFDPGQSIPMYDARNLADSIEGARILISNDYELELIMDKTGLEKSVLLEKTGIIITTLGEKGSRVCTPEGDIDILPAGIRKVLDPTGAGDAYRAGLIKGLVEGKGMREAAMMGSVCAAFAVESYGTQEYFFGPQEFQERLREYSASSS